jgi:membrane-bound metal-dependent hydrolase YbcI (DUF457 family)
VLFFGHIGIAVGIAFIILLIIKIKADYRFVILGSMLPDIIDKPLGIYIFTQALDSGRVFCHTLLFVILLALISLILYSKRRQTWLAFLTLGSAAHIILDEMWETPGILFWPLYGFDFGHRVCSGSYVVQIIKSNYDNLYTYETELIGIVILALFAVYYKLYEPARMKAFLLRGELGTPILSNLFSEDTNNKITNK